MIFDVKITQSELNISSEIVSDKSLHFVVDFPIWIKGEKGDPFTYADFTAEQIKQLQQPALEAADKANTVSDKVIVIEGTVIKNEDNRIVNENTRIENEKERSDGFSSAITLIGNKVEASEKATTDATDAAKNAQETASHPTYIGDDHYVYRWNATEKEYYRTDIYSKGDTGLSAYEYAVRGGYKGTEAQFIQEQVDIIGNGDRLTAVENGKADKPIAGRTFLTPLFVARGAVFNDKTGYYELNGLTDITEDQMINIYNYTSQTPANQDWTRMFYDLPNARTNFPPKSAIYTPDMTATFASSPFSIIQVSKNLNTTITPTNVTNAFYQSFKLIRVIGIIDLSNISSTGYFLRDVRTLAEITLKNIKASISIADSPNLTRDSILYLINNSNNITHITLTLHQIAKARLTPEDIALASSKNITIA